MEIMVYGAKSIALGTYKAVRELYPEYPIKGFLVSSRRDNPSMLAGVPVWEIGEFSRQVNQEQKENICILIGTPEDIHPEIVKMIETHGYKNYICMDSHREAKLMETYFTKLGVFPSLHSLPGSKNVQLNEEDMPKLQVFMIQFYKDRPLESVEKFPEWVYPIQVGAALTDVRTAEITDDTGENISKKNGNYCEMTAFYWLWKNRLMDVADEMEYYGFFHYRRILDIKTEDLKRIKANNVDVILQFPTLHEPDIREHHARYVREEDWEAMLQALEELRPEYAKAYSEIFSQTYFYNYNLIIAKKRVLADYCTWLFPILERTEELSSPRGWERSDRYTAYMSESLLTLYFLYNQKRLNICHTGRFMLT
ncbi:DUF4422 domain-containing protein [Lachnospiraceae bacterium 62-35]